jgi:hypothetical protein
MGTPRDPKPVKLFVALLSSEETLLTQLESDLADLIGGSGSAELIVIRQRC